MSVGILTSGVALGVHVPGLLLGRRLTEAGLPARVDVLQSYLPPPQRDRLHTSKVAFHRDFRVALAAQRLANRNQASPTQEAAAALMSEWEDAHVSILVCFSGFWLPIAYQYAASHPEVRVHACHVDSVIAPSYAAAVSAVTEADKRNVNRSDVWLLEERAGTVARTIPVSRDEPLNWSARNGRLLAHGGGWGMGTYARDAGKLAARGWALDLIAYEQQDVTMRDDGHRYFMIDPSWQPWHDAGFPPLGQVRRDGTVDYQRDAQCHGSFYLAREAVAMVSKPGGGTLMDSLAAATPVVLLDPFGDHEARNAQLWERLGFGIQYGDWAERGCSLKELEQLHNNLLEARSRVRSYPDSLAELLSGGLYAL